MTGIQTFTGNFNKKNITFFNDFVNEPGPFSFNRSAAGIAPTCSISNAPVGPDQTFGVATISTPAAPFAGVRQYAGIYLAPTVTAGSAITEEFTLKHTRLDMRARVRWGVNGGSTAQLLFGVGTYLPNSNSLGVSSFMGFYADAADTWVAISKAVVNGDYSFNNTVYPSVSWAELRFVWDPATQKKEYYVNRVRVAVPPGNTPALTTGLVPYVQFLDRSLSGPPAICSALVDYFSVSCEVSR